ncbi:hypothetical protein LCGC14_1001270 [marine sediment metagenome]|uniref:Uncharacterized protein n=1 Tax=marine sediment metagenome TaxID=412755 RepID=A0A0F9QLE2_9ZZZZ
MSEDKDAKNTNPFTKSASRKSYPVTPETKEKLDAMVKKIVTYKPKPKSK